MQLHQIRSIGGRGLTPESFHGELPGIHVDRSGALWAIGGSTLKHLDGQGRLVRQWKTAVAGVCVTVDHRNRVWLGGPGQIAVYDPDGMLQDTWQDGARLGRVTSIGFAGTDILLADATHRCIRRYDASRRFLNDIGAGNNTRGFLIPNGHLEFSVDKSGVIHAANPGKYRIERYTPAGDLLGHFGRFGTREPAHFPGCCNPTNLALMPDGRVVVTEKAPPRLKVYAADGTLLALAGPEFFDANCRNMDVAVGPEGLIHVVDTVRLQIQVFECREVSDENRPAAAKGAARP